jgi:hypothetical protein
VLREVNLKRRYCQIAAGLRIIAALKNAREAEISFCSFFFRFARPLFVSFFDDLCECWPWTKGVQSSALNLLTVPLTYQSSQCLSYQNVLEVFKVTKLTNG